MDYGSWQAGEDLSIGVNVNGDGEIDEVEELPDQTPADTVAGCSADAAEGSVCADETGSSSGDSSRPESRMGIAPTKRPPERRKFTRLRRGWQLQRRERHPERRKFTGLRRGRQLHRQERQPER